MRTVLLFLAGAAVAWGTACTAAAAGNWSAQTTWGTAGTGCAGAAAGGIPGNLDTVTIGYPVTVDVNTTIGTSQADATNVTPPTPAIFITKTTNATGGSNGQLTVNSGVTFTVRGSVKCTGIIHNYAPIINLNPGSTWTFDNSQAPSSGTGVYRIWGTVANSFTAINAVGSGWAAGQFITINGKDTAACTAASVTCVGAMWTNENQLTGGTFGTFTHEYQWVKWNYMGSPTDQYRAISLACSDANGDNTKFHMLHTVWQNSAGWHSASYYPCQHVDYDVEYIQTLNSTTSATNGFFSDTPSSVAHVTSPVTVRILRYAYFDTGMNSNGGNTNFFGFDTVSYVVFDRQATSSFCPNAVANTAIEPTNIDHMLIRQTQNLGWFLCGSSSYLLVAADGGQASPNIHSAQTGKLSTGSFTWNIDHAIWQYGEGTAASSDTDQIDSRAASTVNFPTNFQYLLLLPSASSRLANYAGGMYAAVVGSETKYNHTVWAFGQDGGGVGSNIIGSMYIGEGDTGTAGTIWVKNTIFWSPHAAPDPNFSPITVYSGGAGGCTAASGGIYLGNCTANAFDPVNIHNNLVWNYGTGSQRWTSSVTGCSGGGSVNGGACASGCSSCGTPYDFKMTGTVPGAHDLWGTASGPNPQYTPSFVWQAQSLKGAGPREWANYRFGADIQNLFNGQAQATPSGCVATDTCTEAWFASTFNVFATANVDDTTSSCTGGASLTACSAAGLKGRIDDMFSWIYAMWASTNPALKGAADDAGVTTINGYPNTAAGDIGVTPVALQCPTAPIGADPSKPCNWISQNVSPAVLESLVN